MFMLMLIFLNPDLTFLNLGLTFLNPALTFLRPGLRVGCSKNLKIFDLILTSKFEVFWGLSSKNLDISSLDYPQNLILNLKTAVLILTLNFEVFFEDPQ